MQQPKKSGCLGFVASVWRGIDLATRIILNLIVLTVVFTLLALALPARWFFSLRRRLLQAATASPKM